MTNAKCSVCKRAVKTIHSGAVVCVPCWFRGIQPDAETETETDPTTEREQRNGVNENV